MAIKYFDERAMTDMKFQFNLNEDEESIATEHLYLSNEKSENTTMFFAQLGNNCQSLQLLCCHQPNDSIPSKTKVFPDNTTVFGPIKPATF